jgi:TetR/AcrR family transcriptional regulator, transcriptional repressor for nem operon
MNAKTEQKEQSHETILDSAARLVREKGIAGAGVAQVMKGAGLTVGGFYAHFASKEALIDEALRRTGARMRNRLFEKIEDKPKADRADVVLKRYLSATNRDQPTIGCPLPAVVGEVGSTAPEYHEVLSEQVTALAKEMEKHLPEEANELSPKLLALGLVALMYGGLSLARAVRDTPLSDEMLKACRALGKLALANKKSP